MIAPTKYAITKLNGDNYFNWRYKLKMVLVEKGVWKVVNDAIPNPVTDEWRKNDEIAHSTIALNVEDDQIQYIRQCDTAKTAWEKLMEVHEKDSANNRISILRRIMNQRLEEGGDAEAHVNRMNELFQKMTALGGNISQDLIFSAFLLGSLPESYDNLITALEARDEELTSSVVCSKVITEYKRRDERKTGNKESENSILKIYSNGTKPKSCTYCEKPGHLKSNCFAFKKELEQQRELEKLGKSNKEESHSQCANLIYTEEDCDDDGYEFLF